MKTKKEFETLFGFLEQDTTKLIKAVDEIKEYINKKTNGRYKELKIGKNIDFITLVLNYWHTQSEDCINEMKSLKAFKTNLPRNTIRKKNRRN